MEIENSFAVAAPPDRVYGYLLEVNNVVSCVPGAELAEVVDPDTFKGKVRIKVGPVTVSYNGTARITNRDPESRTATLQAEGRETTGAGSANATTTMSVREEGGGSVVTLKTDFSVVGRIAQFGRGIMEDVSRHLVGQMADCIRSSLEASEAGAPAGNAADADAFSSPGTVGAEATSGPTTVDADSAVGASLPDTAERTGPGGAASIDAFALGRAVARERLSRAGRAPQIAGLALGALLLVLVVLRLRRHRG